MGLIHSLQWYLQINMESRVILHLLFCLIVSLLVIQNVMSVRDLASIRFDKLETFLTGQQSSIYHIEVDLYKNDGSLLFSDYRFMKSTDGKTTETIVGSTTSGYQEGRGTSAQFVSITGFKQINTTHVAIADNGNHCIRMLNRKSKTTSRLAGVCKAHGFTNGKSGKFSNPWGIEKDPNNPAKLLVTENNNNALRSVDISTGEISTVVSTGLKHPCGLSWNSDKTSLLITNNHYITEVKFDINGTVISNVILTGSTTSGSTEGAFESARFYYPYEMAPISKNLVIVADGSNSRVRILDTLTNKTVPVCLSSATTCNYLTVSRPYSILVDGTDVYMGYSQRIYKLSGYSCSAENITAYLPADKDTVEVKISVDYVASLPVGTHEFKNMQRNDKCGDFYVNIKAPKGSEKCKGNITAVTSPETGLASLQLKPDVTHTLSLPVGTYHYAAERDGVTCSSSVRIADNLVKMRVDLKAVYRVSCSRVNHPNTKSTVLSVVESHFHLLQRICVNDCRRQPNSQAMISCTDDALSVIWPTDRTFSGNETVNAAQLQATLSDRAQKEKLVFQLVIVNRVPPVVQPKTIDVVLTEFCAGDKIYMQDSQTCP